MPAGRAAERSSLVWVENAFAVCTEATECHAEGEAQVVGGGLGVELLDVGRERLAFGAVDGELGPVLGVAPGEGPGDLNSTEGSRWDSCFVKAHPRSSELCPV